MVFICNYFLQKRHFYRIHMNQLKMAPLKNTTEQLKIIVREELNNAG